MWEGKDEVPSVCGFLGMACGSGGRSSPSFRYSADIGPTVVNAFQDGGNVLRVGIYIAYDEDRYVTQTRVLALIQDVGYQVFRVLPGGFFVVAACFTVHVED